MTIAPTPVRQRPARWLAALAVAGVVVFGVTGVLLARQTSSHGSSGSQVTIGSGVAAAQQRRVPSFSGVDLAGSNNVTVRVGSRRSVVVRGDDNLLGRVTTAVRAGRLVIDDTGSFSTRSPMRVDVTVPALDTLLLSGSGNVTAEGIDAQRLRVTLSGSGTVRASGNATRLDVSLGGSGDLRLEGVAARDVHAVLTGSGRMVVDATGSLDAVVRGSGAIVYHGDPADVTKSITGSGSITQG